MMVPDLSGLAYIVIAPMFLLMAAIVGLVLWAFIPFGKWFLVLLAVGFIAGLIAAYILERK